MSCSDDVRELRRLETVRGRCSALYALAEAGRTRHFQLDKTKLPNVVDKVAELLGRDYKSPGDVPYHSRWRHFEVGGVDRVAALAASWGDSCDARERARRLIDLATVSVLLDAGAGDRWSYTEPRTGQVLSRSEGLGVASFHMFEDGAFSSSSDPSGKHRADAEALAALPPARVAEAFQATAVDGANPLVGCEGRAAVLNQLGGALQLHPEYFEGSDGVCRPGNMVDFLAGRAKPGTMEVSIADVWEVLMYGFESLWPAGRGRTSLDGHNMGDVWPHSDLPLPAGQANGSPASADAARLVPFHKLSQWMTYSLLEPLEEAGFVLTSKELLTGLPEYRNGGLFVDMGVLTPKDPAVRTTPQDPASEVVVEWRALTVCLLDEVHLQLRHRLAPTEPNFPLAKTLEAGTWKAGREVAKQLRPQTGAPPIQIVSDGTVF